VPELPEVEAYRQLASARALRRPISAVAATDAWMLKGSTDADGLGAALVGATFVAARRRGKLLLLDTDAGGVLGLRFGMTGRLIVDDEAGVDWLLYSSRRDERIWDRFAVHLADGGVLRLHDPRRLGGVELDPDESLLGPDALTLTPADLRGALAGSTVALKARLLDQRHVAGIGNLLGDELLWRAGLAPQRPAGSLTPAELRRLHRHLRATVEQLLARGGSHTGDLLPHRTAGGRCPRDGAALRQTVVGGRTTWYCPHHQR
jgi:formamidopyrimidine-DNA glycosylase